MSPTKRPKAYSYLRFSTPEQAQGDSFRRQTALAQRYAEMHGLDLDHELTFRDPGVSAYQGKNAQRGSLADFLHACRSGVVVKGSYLLLESLDRLSRQTARRAVRILEEICEEGVVVVTLNDGQEYTEERLDRDPMSFLMSFVSFMRAHEESAMKAARLKAVWDNKRQKAGPSFKTTSVCPEWLEAVKDQHGRVIRHDPIPERVRIVRRIFRDYTSGTGAESIARALNAKGVPTFGGGRMWYRSYIRKVLDNPAVIGTYCSYVSEFKEGRRVLKLEREVKGYYPAIVEPKVFEAVRAMKDGGNDPRRGRHAGKPLRTIFGGLARCPKCNGTMQHVNKGAPPKGGRYFVCGAARMGKGCDWKSVRAEAAERALEERFEELLGRVPRTDPHARRIASRLEALQAEIEGTTTARDNVLEAIQSVGNASAPASLMQRLRELEEALTALGTEERDLYARQDRQGRTQIEARAKALADALREEQRDLVKANALMRQVFAGVVMDYESGKLRFQWQHGAESAIRFAWAE